MVRTLLVRGMVAGVVAGLLAAVFAYLIGEATVDVAIGFESTMAGHGGHDEVELVSRGVQSTVGLSVAVTAYGVAIGGVFALIFALSLGRMRSRPAPRPRALALAATGFAVVALVPFLKYPANPPSVGQPDTIGERTALYFGFTVLSVLAFTLALYLRSRMRGSVDDFSATAATAGGYLLLVALAGWAMPAIDEVPHGFPASLLWSFRLSSLGTQVVLWGSLGLLFGALAERVIEARTKAEERRRVFAA